jgi:dTDP-4-amino-4,6-dideoxygalactose transaminase
MNNVNATIGLVQLEHVAENVLKYIENGKFFDQHLHGIDGLMLIPYYHNTSPSYWLYTIKVNRRDDFIKMMTNNGIMASPLHLRNDRHSVFNAKHAKLPNLDAFYSSFVHTPCGWWLTNEDRLNIVSVIKKGW